MQYKLLTLAVAASVLLTACDREAGEYNPSYNFNRITSLPVCQQIHPTCDDDSETVAEIVAASTDGNTLIYTDSEQEQLGFADITDPAKPVTIGAVKLPGEPTSVTVKGEYALVGVNTSEDYINVSGELAVVDIEDKKIIHTIDVGGQPDSVAVSPDGQYVAVVIENERDEDLGEGIPPQMPAGNLVVVELDGEPNDWETNIVNLEGLAEIFPEDPEPEYVDINEDNLAVVTMQENNHIVLVDLEDAKVKKHFSAGTVDLAQVDGTEEKPRLISLTEELKAVPREPDGVSWIDEDHFATADEGDMDGGSRGFTIFNTKGKVVYTSGNTMDHMAVRLGHYPEKRSANKGNEPENIEYGVFGEQPYLFVNSERANLVFVYSIVDPKAPVLHQVLPAGVGPEGGLALPERELLVVASEKDDRGDKMRSVLNIYQRSETAATYPSIQSTDRADGTPIPWSALSGLAADPNTANILYTVEDSFYGSNRIMAIDVSTQPARLNKEIIIKDSNDVLASIATQKLIDKEVDHRHATRSYVFDELDLAALINDDKTVNIDPEGVVALKDGGFWVASEGNGTIGDNKRPIKSLNFIVKTDANGAIENVVTPPAPINGKQLRFGFEGVTEYNGSIYVAFQRAWQGDDHPRIGVYNLANKSWSFFFYPLDKKESQRGGWVGLSDITSLGGGKFLVIERDNQGGPDAAIKRLYQFDINGLKENAIVTKALVRDLLAEGDLTASGGLAFEKIEGLAVTSDIIYVNNDNDGVDDNSGENQLIKLSTDLLK